MAHGHFGQWDGSQDMESESQGDNTPPLGIGPLPKLPPWYKHPARVPSPMSTSEQMAAAAEIGWRTTHLQNALSLAQEQMALAGLLRNGLVEQLEQVQETVGQPQDCQSASAAMQLRERSDGVIHRMQANTGALEEALSLQARQFRQQEQLIALMASGASSKLCTRPPVAPPLRTDVDEEPTWDSGDEANMEDDPFLIKGGPPLPPTTCESASLNRVITFDEMEQLCMDGGMLVQKAYSPGFQDVGDTRKTSPFQDAPPNSKIIVSFAELAPNHNGALIDSGVELSSLSSSPDTPCFRAASMNGSEDLTVASTNEGHRLSDVSLLSAPADLSRGRHSSELECLVSQEWVPSSARYTQDVTHNLVSKESVPSSARSGRPHSSGQSSGSKHHLTPPLDLSSASHDAARGVVTQDPANMAEGLLIRTPNSSQAFSPPDSLMRSPSWARELTGRFNSPLSQPGGPQAGAAPSLQSLPRRPSQPTEPSPNGPSLSRGIPIVDRGDALSNSTASSIPARRADFERSESVELGSTNWDHTLKEPQMRSCVAARSAAGAAALAAQSAATARSGYPEGLHLPEPTSSCNNHVSSAKQESSSMQSGTLGIRSMPPNLGAMGPRGFSGLDPAAVPPTVSQSLAGPTKTSGLEVVSGRAALAGGPRIPAGTNTAPSLYQDDLNLQIGLESCSSAQLVISAPTPAVQQEVIHQPQAAVPGAPVAPADPLRGWAGPQDQPKIPRPSSQRILAVGFQNEPTHENSRASTPQSDNIPAERSGTSPSARGSENTQDSQRAQIPEEHPSMLPLPCAPGRGAALARPPAPTDYCTTRCDAIAEEPGEITQYRVWDKTERQNYHRERSLFDAFATNETSIPDECVDGSHHKPLLDTDEETLQPIVADNLPSVMSRRRPVWGMKAKQDPRWSSLFF